MREEISSEEIEMETSEINPKDNLQALEENYLILNGKFNYGSRIKNYGFFSICVDIKSKELIKIISLSGSNRDIWGINLQVDSFRKDLDEIVSNFGYGNNNTLKIKLKDELDFTEIIRLVNSNQLKEIEIIIQEIIESVIQEPVNLKLDVESVNKERVKDSYPELSLEKNEEEEIDNKDNNGQSPKKEKLNIDIKLNCQPIVSPVKGKRIKDLNLGDEIIVKVTDERDVSKSLSQILEGDKGEIVGIIKEISFNEELGRYKVLVQLNSQIYGSLIVDSEVKIKTKEIISTDIEDDEEGLVVDQNILIIAVFLLIMVMLLVGITIYYI